MLNERAPPRADHDQRQKQDSGNRGAGRTGLVQRGVTRYRAIVPLGDLMDAGLSWMKTVLALVFFLCVLYLMPEAASAGPVSVSAPASVGRVHDDQRFAWVRVVGPSGDWAVPSATDGAQ